MEREMELTEDYILKCNGCGKIIEQLSTATYYQYIVNTKIYCERCNEMNREGKCHLKEVQANA